MAEKVKNEAVAPEIPMVHEARATQMARNNFLLTLSEILPATSPKEAYGMV